jgi:hypothetical protein
MAALIVEDGSTVPDANTYVSAADFSTYMSDRGLTFSGSNGTQEQVLLKAMDYIEAQNFIGFKKSKEQALQWPRTEVYIDGYAYESDEIPSLLLKLQMEVSIAIDAGNDPSANVGRATKREKVGDIEVEYMDSADDSLELVAVKNVLKKIATPTSSKSASIALVRS